MKLDGMQVLAKTLEKHIGEGLLDEFSAILKKRGVRDCHVVSFTVAPEASKELHISFAGQAVSRCPTRCWVTPTGSVICVPVC